MAASTRLTQETYERLQAELEDLKTRGRIEIAKAIEAARALGDLSENGDYHAAKDTQGKMEARIRQLEATLEDAQIVDGSIGDDGVVGVGAVVSLRYVGDDDVERYLIGSIEERQEGVTVVSPDSALGQALDGRREGDKVAYQTPTGATLEVEIVKVGA
jgi:transcription elongation factor GreA